MKRQEKSARIGLRILVIGLIFFCSAGIEPPAKVWAASAKEIDAGAEAALERFYKEIKGAEDFAKTAKGMLVLPGVIKGFFFVGGEYGEGALRIGGRSAAYYNLIAASYGLTFGGERKDIVIVFMTDEALRKFQTGEGWKVGVDGNVALMDAGGGARIDTTTIKEPILAFVFGVKGLIADVSLKGAKFNRLQK